MAHGTSTAEPSPRTRAVRPGEVQVWGEAEMGGRAEGLAGWDDGEFSIREASPQDVAALREFADSWRPETRYQRLFNGRRLTDDELWRIANPASYANLGVLAQSRGTVLGSAECVQLAEPRVYEVALSVRDGWQSQGLGTQLLEVLLERARNAGAVRVVGMCLAGNQRVLRLARRFAFSVRRHPGDAHLNVLELDLNSAAHEGYPTHA